MGQKREARVGWDALHAVRGISQATIKTPKAPSSSPLQRQVVKLVQDVFARRRYDCRRRRPTTVRDARNTSIEILEKYRGIISENMIIHE